MSTLAHIEDLVSGKLQSKPRRLAFRSHSPTMLDGFTNPNSWFSTTNRPTSSTNTGVSLLFSVPLMSHTPEVDSLCVSPYTSHTARSIQQFDLSKTPHLHTHIQYTCFCQNFMTHFEQKNVCQYFTIRQLDHSFNRCYGLRFARWGNR